MKVKICAFCPEETAVSEKEDKKSACITAKPEKRARYIRTILIPSGAKQEPFTIL